MKNVNNHIILFVLTVRAAKQSTGMASRIPGPCQAIIWIFMQTMKLFQNLKLLKVFERNLTMKIQESTTSTWTATISRLIMVQTMVTRLHTIVLRTLSEDETQDVGSFYRSRSVTDRWNFSDWRWRVYGKNYIVNPFTAKRQSGYTGKNHTENVIWSNTDLWSCCLAVIRFFFLPEYVVWI
jgi:hypothetical protein